MAEWTQKEIEELMVEMTKKSMTDPEFRREILADANAALEKLAGRPLPNGVSLKCIEKDPNYQSTFVLPDLMDEEKLDEETLAQVGGGISVLGIVSFCVSAVGIGPDVLACLQDMSAEACIAKFCGSHECAGQACAILKDDTQPHCHAQACALQSCDRKFW